MGHMELQVVKKPVTMAIAAIDHLAVKAHVTAILVHHLDIGTDKATGAD